MVEHSKNGRGGAFGTGVKKSCREKIPISNAVILTPED